MINLHVPRCFENLVHFEKFNKKFGGTMKCHVCTNDVSEAHQCELCKNNVHLICGNLEGDESYSKSVVRFTCSKKGL